MWSPWIFGHSGGVADEFEHQQRKKEKENRKSTSTSKTATRNNEPVIREEMVQSAINFLSHPNVRY